jgi:hypothetical protein
MVLIAGLPSSIHFLTIAMPSIRASLGVMKVRLQVYLVNSSLLLNPISIREKRAGFAGMNWLSGDAKLMTFVPIVSCVHPSSASSRPLLCGCWGLDDSPSEGTFH